MGNAKRIRGKAIAIAVGLGATLLLTVPAIAPAALHGKYVGKSPEAKLTLNLKKDSSDNSGKLFVRGASPEDTVGHFYVMDCGKRTGNKRNVFGKGVLTPENPILLSGAVISPVKGRYCKIELDEDQTLWTELKLTRK